MAASTDDKKASEIEKLLAQGEQKLNALDFQGAMTRFNKVIKIDPGDPRGYFNKAETFIGIPKKTVNDIIELYEKAIELDNKNPIYYVRYGSFCLENSFFRKAEECYRNAAKIDSENAYLYYSEFAIEFYYTANRLLESMDDESRKKTTMISIYYLVLRTLNLSKKHAVEYLGELDPVKPPFEILEELEKQSANF